ncbi:hypothetical protein EVAR_51263_1 [Eumeta japonica]|uniref:Uncharacterized protein n=1 Tax=Eumeta variegata TaxID=151549 RepID=A0A4C1YAQ9_EUMVA|nr:hypothetical protein EVAR_51263_1 [Eumeta japonica]
MRAAFFVAKTGHSFQSTLPVLFTTELQAGRKCPELLRQKDGTAVFDLAKTLPCPQISNHYSLENDFRLE